MNEVLVQELGVDAKLTIPEFLQTTRVIRQELGTEPITYTDLRKRVIREEFQRRGVRQSDLERYVEEAYTVWIQERHKAAERHLFDDTISCLTKLQERNDVCVAAITNGRGNPLEMKDTLAGFFDFRVSGEDPHVFPNRKPHGHIYEVAMRQYQELYPHHNGDRIWCRIGDCLANDVGASADAGAYAIWYCPEDDVETSSKRFQGKNKEPSWSTASQADIAKRKALAQDKAAGRISRLSELESTLEELLTNVQTKEYR